MSQAHRRRPRRIRFLATLAFAAATCPAAAPAAEPSRDAVPASMRACWSCHRETVADYLRHGMAASVGAVGRPPAGEVVNPRTGSRYRVVEENGEIWLIGTFPDGGTRRQRLVGRIGAGRLDTSFVGAEAGVFTGEETGRLFFAPVEQLAGHGWILSPFELHDDSPGMDMALTRDCLTCHVAQDLTELPKAAVAMRGGRRSIFPPNALGGDAFEALSGIGCEGCHGDTRRHRERMAGVGPPVEAGDTALQDLGALPIAAQRDLCARCHLQGDVRMELVPGRPDPGRSLAGQIPVLTTARGGDDFRFVSQVSRLALSPCFRGSPAMTCTTCHDPHQGVEQQGTAAFDSTCGACHADRCSRPPDLRVEAVTGDPSRTAAGCVDCHMRRSPPFDLPDVRSADHFIRRRIPPPEEGIEHRPFADRDGPLELYGTDRLSRQLATEAGRRWRTGVLAIGLASLGRLREAAARFDELPAPGSPAAVAASAPPGLEPLERRALFHETRGLVLMASGRLAEAELAYSDALKVDPTSASAWLGRAQLRLGRGDTQGTLDDTQQVIDLFPSAEQPWDVRNLLAERLARSDLALGALAESTRRWPSNPFNWLKLGVLLRQQGHSAEALHAFQHVRLLRPSLRDPTRKP